MNIIRHQVVKPADDPQDESADLECALMLLTLWACVMAAGFALASLS